LILNKFPIFNEVFIYKLSLEGKRVALRSIPYISMDHPSIGLLCTEAIKDLLKVYSRYILPQVYERVYIFLAKYRLLSNGAIT
jgi:hypothetical protein